MWRSTYVSEKWTVTHWSVEYPSGDIVAFQRDQLVLFERDGKTINDLF